MRFKFRMIILLVAVVIFTSIVYEMLKCYYIKGDGREKSTRGITFWWGVSAVRDQLSCETVHVALVVAGYNTTRSAVTVMKSIFFYRHSPLHFHFISDSSAQIILEKLLNTWELPSVNYSFYSAESLKNNVSWIPNAHYSGVFGLMKLLLPSILPPSIDRVIIVDTDVTVVCDIHELWAFFDEVRKEGKVLALVENQSDWYLGTIWVNHRPWPALGRGFNTGVMLIDLRAAKKITWHQIWKQVTQEVLKIAKYTSLADQDIINALIKSHPHIHYTLPCSWNVQLSENAHSEECYMGTDQYKIVHWNSPLKLSVKNKHASYFRTIHSTFMEYDGNLLRHGLLRCKIETENSNHHYQNYPCVKFLEESRLSFRTHLYFHGQQYHSPDKYDVTLVSQLSIDRLHNLDTITKHWVGPISFALYATDSEAWQFLQYLEFSSVIRKRNNIAVHIMYKQGHLYPINHLRNIAMETVTSPYVFLSDIDFIPMFGLYSHLKEAVKVLKLDTQRSVLVVPAFETLKYKFSYPHNKQTLLQMIKDGEVDIFRHSVWKQGHAATNYNKWYKASHPYKINWAPDFEPYITVTRNVSKYPEMFMGFGWNKVSHIMELDAKGFEFVVLPDAFIIHTPHAPSLDISHYRSSKQYRHCLSTLKRIFIEELIIKYGQNATKYRDCINTEVQYSL